MSQAAHQDCVSAVVSPLESCEKADAHPQREAVDAFLLAKRVAGCTQRTLDTYGWWLERFASSVPEVSPLSVRQFFAGLQHLSASRQHQAYRTLKTFLRWCVETALLTENPMQGFSMRKPKTLPAVPTEEELQAVVTACADTLEGMRNRTVLLVLADAGYARTNCCTCWLRIGGRAAGGLFVRAGKGRKDRVALATSWLRGAELEKVRRLLGHESLSTTLRYSNLVGADLQRARKRAGAIERLRLD